MDEIGLATPTPVLAKRINGFYVKWLHIQTNINSYLYSGITGHVYTNIFLEILHVCVIVLSNIIDSSELSHISKGPKVML